MMWYGLIGLMRQMMMISLRSKDIQSVDILKNKASDLIATYANTLKMEYAPVQSRQHLEDAIHIASYFPVIMEYISHSKDIPGDMYAFVEMHQKIHTRLNLNLFEAVKKAVTPQTDWERMVKNTLSDDLSKVVLKIIKQQLSDQSRSFHKQNYMQKVSTLQKALSVEKNLTLGHLIYGIKILHQLTETSD
jgi:hypothetical protein